MARWNHFKDSPYKKIEFFKLKIGDIFRAGQKYIKCIKTGELSYIEQRSKKEYQLFRSTAEFMVYEVDPLPKKTGTLTSDGF